MAESTRDFYLKYSREISYAHISLKNGEKLYVAFENEPTKIVAQCNLPMFISCKKSDIPNSCMPVHFYYYGDKSIEQINKNDICE